MSFSKPAASLAGTASNADPEGNANAGPGTSSLRWRTDGLLQQLGPPFVKQQPPQALPSAHWVAVNDALAAQLGVTDWLAGPAALPLLSGNTQPAHGATASAYSGHQFGVWAGRLGDGRALLLGELDSPLGAQELQLKGAGLTPYSRMGDGRAVLRSSIREYLCSEAMHHLGIPSTRALAIVGSPLPVRRETLETAAVVTRVAPSFLRFGHFEHYTHTEQDTQALKTLADAVIARFHPALVGTAAPYAAWLQEVAERTARLMAQWQAVGFCHGVMNTDNLSILGLTLDYGPFGFMDAFDPGHICNHTDSQGRYAYARQPAVAFWNLHALAQALLPLFGVGDGRDGSDGGGEGDREAAQQQALAAVEPYKAVFADAMLAALRGKLGLQAERDEDRALADDLLRLMAQDHTDFTITFRRLAGFSSTGAGASAGINSALRDLFIDRPAFDAWAVRYSARLLLEHSVDAERAARMNCVNPKFVLRNHLADIAITRARSGDFSEVQRLLKVLQRPFDEQPEHAADAGFPPDWAKQLEVSCSS
ncbi:MAG: YdiU family protein [Rubrivivax sp.]|nr:YdiU family protein [Rubrivivax sp.]